MTNERLQPATNTGLSKVAAQWLHEFLCFISSFVVTESYLFRNHQLLVAAKR